MKPCCRILTYLSESPISGYYLGQCSTCGSLRHGAKSNWRVRTRKGKVVMVAVKDKKEAKIPRVGTRDIPVTPIITILPSMDLESILNSLKQQGVRVR